jgi:hypothetical protein
MTLTTIASGAFSLFLALELVLIAVGLWEITSLLLHQEEDE